MNLQRAHSTFEVKSFDEDKRILTGLASTPAPDRQDDIVEPKGAQFKLPIPFLWQHDSRLPIGHVIAAKVTSKGIEVTVQLVKTDEPGTLKDRLDEAWQSIKLGLVRGFSIGFKPEESADIEGSWGRRFIKWLWLELSAVTIPANSEATIQTVKSMDDLQLAASGQKAVGSVRFGATPGASGKTPANSGQPTPKPLEGKNMNVQEQLERLRAERKKKLNRQTDLMTKSSEAGETLNAEESTEYDTIDSEMEALDTQIKRLETLEKNLANAAKPPVATTPAERHDAQDRRSPQVQIKRDREDQFKGQSFTRLLIAKAAAQIEQCSPLAIAIRRGWDKSNPMLVEIIKANEVPGGGTGAAEWGHELVSVNNQYTGDFIEYLYGQTLYDKLPLRQVPSNVLIKGQDGAATGYWVGESKAIPATTMDFFDVELRPLKAAALAVISNELILDSSPSAEALVRDGLVQASSQRVDTTFLSAAAAVANVSPAGILNGVSALTASGEDADALRCDIARLYAPFLTAKNSRGLALILNPGLAKQIGLMVNALGQQTFPGLGSDGGKLLDDTVYTGDNVAADDMILLKPSDIYRIGDSGVQVSISREAMIEQSTVPTGATDTPVAASQAFTSMFQEDSTAIKVVRRINFAKRRASAVQYVGDAEYGQCVS